MPYLGQDLTDTIVALATPPGVSAIAVIRLSGKEAVTAVARIFEGKDLSTADPNHVYFGSIVKGGQLIDEVLVTCFHAPRSYTGEDVVEISCHGSPYVAQRILEVILKGDIRMAGPGEFTLRAFLNGKMDLSQAEAVADLIASTSQSGHDVAIKQMRGGFSRELSQLRERLIHFASLLELELDFAEEDVDFADRDKLDSLIREILVVITRLIRSFQLGNVIKRGVPTVIAGRPNAGKSTLLNALLSEERAIVSEIPGTTRDTIEEILNINGVEFRLIDTAGLREAQDQIEVMGVQRTLEKIRGSALLLYIFDVAQLDREQVGADLEKLVTGSLPYLAVANKMDLNPYAKAEDYKSALLTEDRFIPISAINEMNIEYLKERIFDTIFSDGYQQESTIVSNSRHHEALVHVRDRLETVREGLSSGITGDLLALDIRHALHYLGEITGEISTEDLLDNIFRKFCIGK